MTTTPEFSPIPIDDEMKRSYLDYAMSVIVSRAIPDVRDGLKPVHRRILYGMREIGLDHNKPYKKSARTVGDVMAKYHPHGDSAIYDALVRMAQPFSMSLPLVDGQGNFGSMDGDAPAAMRYTEARLAKAAHSLLNDLDKDTVDFQENYDGSEHEPVVLPAEYPNLLVNGAGGIAVGMATNIPPHNIGEVIDACCVLIDDPEAGDEALLEACPGPDFPTGGLILGRGGIFSAMRTGRGSITIRAKSEIEEIRSGRFAVVFTEMPYQVNKAKVCERIGELVREKRIEGISDLRDESDRHGVRLVVEVKKDAVPEVVLNQLYSYTQLQTNFGVNMLALNGGRPEQLNFRQVLQAFIQFREEVITRRIAYLLGKARDRAHVLIGLAIAVANIDEVIKVIRAAANPDIAKAELMRRDWSAGDVLPLLALVDDENNKVNNDQIKFTEAQAKAILELRLQRLTGLEREKIDNEMQNLSTEIKGYLELLGSREKLIALLREELMTVREQFAVPRRTTIEEGEFEHDDEDLIQREDMVVTVTLNGYIKRTPLSTYRAQRRGGKGRAAMNMRDEDVTSELLVVNTHTPVLFFSNLGKVYKLKVYRLPLGGANTRGKALVNVFPLTEGETITTFMPLPEDEALWDDMHIMFATSQGTVRRNDLSDFHNVMANGKIAMKLDEGDSIIGVRYCSDEQHVLLAAKSGKCIRFRVNDIRVFRSRTSTGVRGIKLAENDELVSMSILGGVELNIEERNAYLKRANAKRRELNSEEEIISEEELEESTENAIELDDARFDELEAKEEFIFTVTENGYGKRSSAYEYRVTGRGGSGLSNIVTSKRTGAVVASYAVAHDEDIMLITDKATLIRTPVNEVRIAGRNTQGVTIIRTGADESVISAVRVPATENEDEEISDDASAGNGTAGAETE